MHTYSIVLDHDADAGMFTVTVPSLPGCVTQGATREECIERVQEAIAVHVAGLQADGLPVPVETEHPEMIQVTVAA
jgi:predicted RNase H-like HicB family nuclease